jgi:hypothetical protein
MGMSVTDWLEKYGNELGNLRGWIALSEDGVVCRGSSTMKDEEYHVL